MKFYSSALFPQKQNENEGAESKMDGKFEGKTLAGLTKK